MATLDSFSDPKTLTKLLDNAGGFSQQRFPLHYAILTMSDAECADYFETANDTAEWNRVDDAGDTVLHLAARGFKPMCVQWLMARQCSMKSTRNLQGCTPLETLENALETHRAQRAHITGTRVDISDRFNGFPEEAVACLAALWEMGDAHDLLPVEKARLTYGCSCGECLEGFMSPLMLKALLFQAEVTYDLLADETFGEGSPVCDWFESQAHHIPSTLRSDFRGYGSLKPGFTDVFGHIITCLLSDKVPTSHVVHKHFSIRAPRAQKYSDLDRRTGDKIRAALRVLIEQMRKQDAKAGDGTFEMMMEEDVADLKRCRNDHEFGVVARALGLPDGRT